MHEHLLLFRYHTKESPYHTQQQSYSGGSLRLETMDCRESFTVRRGRINPSLWWSQPVSGLCLLRMRENVRRWGLVDKILWTWYQGAAGFDSGLPGDLLSPLLHSPIIFSANYHAQTWASDALSGCHAHQICDQYISVTHKVWAVRIKISYHCSASKLWSVHHSELTIKKVCAKVA